MSGEIPDFLLKDHFVLVNGKPALVKDVYHVSLGPNGEHAAHNSDYLKVDLGGVGDIYFGSENFDIKPLPATSAPEWLKKGVNINFDSKLHGKIVLTDVQEVFGRQARGDDEVATIVKLNGWTAMKYDPDTMKLANS